MSKPDTSRGLATTCTLEQVRNAVTVHLDALWQTPERARTLPPTMLWGPPGVGKSALVRQICEERGIGFVDIRLAQREPVDVRGLPVPVDGVVQWLLPAEYPRDPNSRGIMLFDELTAADRTLQVAAYELILDRRLGDLYQVPPGWYVMAAGNRTGDRAVATTMSSALANRFCHLEVRPDLNGWVRWAQQEGVHPDVVAFLRFQPMLMLDMSGHLERGWPSPRAWERVGLETELADRLGPDTFRNVVCGLVGAGAGLQYVAFREWHQAVPDIAKMLAGKASVVVPERADQRYALCCSVAWHLWKAPNQPAAFDALFTLLERLPADFSAMLAVDCMNAGKPKDVARFVMDPRFAAWGSRSGPTFVARFHREASNIARKAVAGRLPADLPLAADLLQGAVTAADLMGEDPLAAPLLPGGEG